METTNFFEKMASIAGALNIGNLPPAVQGMIRDTVELEQARDFETITRVKEKYFEETTACMKVERREQPGMTEMSEEEMDKLRDKLRQKMDGACFDALMAAVLGPTMESMESALKILEPKPQKTDNEKLTKSLKKQLKHCKNPMEVKAINQQLAKAMKERKKEKQNEKVNQKNT